MKCKGCTGEIAYTPLAVVKEKTPELYYNTGPALTHDPQPPCQWFNETSTTQIIAYINVAEYKVKNATT